MNQKRFITRGIVLSRTNFGEADRILTFLTPEQGKVKVIAKGSRKQKSKLAGGIEPFSVSDLTVLPGKGEINTLMSSRLVRHFGNLSSQLERMNVAAGIMKRIDKITEDQTEAAYYELLNKTFRGLDKTDLPPEISEFWFNLQLLKLTGHAPNLKSDTDGLKLDVSQRYNFDIEKMSFFAAKSGKYNANHIKFLRLSIGLNKPEAIARIGDWPNLQKLTAPLAQSMLKQQLQV